MQVKSSIYTTIANKYNIKSVPTILILDEDNNLVRKMTGLPSTSDDLTKFIYEAN